MNKGKNVNLDNTINKMIKDVDIYFSDNAFFHFEIYPRNELNSFEKLQKKLELTEKKVELFELGLRDKPGCEYCVNAVCDCVVIHEQKVNEILDNCKELDKQLSELEK